jgi:hypothetical protein
MMKVKKPKAPVVIKKYAYLMLRRHGKACTCIKKEATLGLCRKCYGTGIVGGYVAGEPKTMRLRKTIADNDLGWHSIEIECLDTDYSTNYAQGDLLIDTATGQRWKIISWNMKPQPTFPQKHPN